jgi:hypothetical protein
VSQGLGGGGGGAAAGGDFGGDGDDMALAEMFIARLKEKAPKTRGGTSFQDKACLQVICACKGRAGREVVLACTVSSFVRCQSLSLVRVPGFGETRESGPKPLSDRR